MKMNTEEFISAILERPTIWMSSHPQHRFKNIMKKKWREINVFFPEFSEEDLKKKWKSLKDTYRKELRRIPIQQPGDQPIDFEVKWKFFKSMSFLRDELIPTVDDSDFEAQIDATQQICSKKNRTINSEQQNLSLSPSADSTQNLPKKSETPPLHWPAPQPSLHKQAASTAKQAEKRPTPKDLRGEYLQIEKKKLRIMELELAENKNLQPERESEDYYFLMSILPQMERLPPLQKVRLRTKINQALLEEMETLFCKETN